MGVCNSSLFDHLREKSRDLVCESCRISKTSVKNRHHRERKKKKVNANTARSASKSSARLGNLPSSAWLL